MKYYKQPCLESFNWVEFSQWLKRYSKQRVSLSWLHSKIYRKYGTKAYNFNNNDDFNNSDNIIGAGWSVNIVNIANDLGLLSYEFDQPLSDGTKQLSPNAKLFRAREFIRIN